MYILSRVWGKGKNAPTFYVTHRKGEEGVDWAYGDAGQAKPMNEYWKRRFMAEMASMGVQANAREVSPSEV